MKISDVIRDLIGAGSKHSASSFADGLHLKQDEAGNWFVADNTGERQSLRLFGHQEDAELALSNMKNDRPENEDGVIIDVDDDAALREHGIQLPANDYLPERSNTPSEFDQVPFTTKDILSIVSNEGASSPSYPEIDQFVNGASRNAHISSGPYNAYLRRSYRPLEGYSRGDTRENALDLGSIDRQDQLGTMEHLPPEQRGPKGDLGGFMQALEQAAAAKGLDYVYVESILNEFLPEVLQRMGYSADPRANPTSMYKKVR